MSEKSEQIAVRITPGMKNDIEEFAEQDNLTEADAVRALVRLGVNRDRGIRNWQENDEIIEEMHENIENMEEKLKVLDKPLWKRLIE